MRIVRNYLLESRLVHMRLIALLILICVLALILVFRVGYMQIAQYGYLSNLAQNNRINEFPVPAVRGLIYDRNGKVLAENIQVFNLEVVPDNVPDMAGLLDELQQIIPIEEDITHFKSVYKKRPGFERQTISSALSEVDVAKISVNLHRLPGVQLNARLQRHYPYGDLTSHFIGYVGRISSDDLDKVDRDAYRGVDYIGKIGIESYYETELLGQSGVERIETNAHGKVIQTLEQILPQTGQTLFLSIDIDLQREALNAIDGYEGAVIALKPDTGEILAFASAPTYDANAFVNGISHKDYSELRDATEKPLLNRGLYGRYAPGSTIKSFMSLIGMQHDFGHDRRIYCPGFFSLPGQSHKYRDWKRGGHGWMDGDSSIVESCDVFYYKMATELGIDKMHEGMKVFGFGQKTGVDLESEPSGLMPSRAWKQRVRKKPWYPGETVIAGIGQGYVLTTPLQLAATTALLANRGKRVVPSFLKAIVNPQTQKMTEMTPDLGVQLMHNSIEQYEQVVESMRRVVHSEKGTARGIAKDLAYDIAGKTGTAQVKSIKQGETYDEESTQKKYRDHALFIGFAPVKNPQIAVAVIVEHGGSGGRTAAPIARKVMDFYLLEQLQIAPDAKMTQAEVSG